MLIKTHTVKSRNIDVEIHVVERYPWGNKVKRPWRLHCVTHGCKAYFASDIDAWHQMSHPNYWCSVCKRVLRQRAK